ncbi:MAG: RecQ family ATP-dependent DNA helicase, partial [Chloroflexota bacterium]|nr:RecQ family ATP-dependent DNA helicase [Chloroflexota bacterium]
LKARGIAADCINSAMGTAHNQRVQKAAYKGRLDILYVAPERVATPQFRDFLHALKLSLIAIDEAHCISEWGHNFRPDYRELRVLRDNFPTVPVIALTATATERVRQDILDQLGMTHAARFIASFNRPNLTYRVRPKRRSFETLVALLRELHGGSAIIYRFSRKNTESLAADLCERGFKVLPYHAGLEDEERRETQERFLRNDVPIIVATIAFGMGVDKPNVRLVVHYDLPKTIEGYYQETGRAGRDNNPSECVLFYSYGDKINQEYFINQIEDDAERTHAEEKLAQMVAYGEARTCRREFLLSYFGEKWQEENCGACDVCLTASAQPDEQDAAHTYDGTEIAQKVLSAVIRTGERFGVNHVVDVLRGSQARRVRQFHHDTLPVHGIARDLAKDELQDIMDQLSDKELLARRTSGEYPTLYVTTKGRAFLTNRESLALRRQAPPHADAAGELDAVLFEKLRSLRQEIATALNAPAYVVFSDESLRQMTIHLPTDHESLLQIKGVGNTKLSQFGDRFLAVIRKNVAEHGGGSPNPATTSRHATNGSSFAQIRNTHPRAYAQWEPDEDERLASLFQAGRSLSEIALALGRRPGAVASRLRQAKIAPGYRLSLSETETRTLELARHGLSVTEMAAKRGLSAGTVIAHLERIIETDEALDLTHLLPPTDRYAQIVDAFSAESDDGLLKPVKERLGDDYAYEELRLVRLRLRQLSTNIALSSSTFDILARDKDRE